MKKITKKTIKRKTSKPTKPKKEAPNIFYEDHLDLLTLRKKPVSERYIEGIARHLIKWATENDEALILGQFYLANGLSTDILKKWAKRVPKLRAAIYVAKTAIKIRREIGAIKRKYSESMIIKSLPFYSDSWTEDEDWKKLEEWRAKLRESIEKGKGNTIVKVIAQDYRNPPKVEVEGTESDES